MVTLTETASRKLSELLSQQTPPVLGLRLSVKQGGCSGYSYGMSFAESAEPGDWVGEFGGVKVFVDPESLPLINGTTVDFVKQGINEAFRFHNPNTKGECGCGESFSV